MTWEVKNVHFSITGSTQDEAKYSSKDLKPGIIIAYTANEQTKGRGTNNRMWSSPPDVNIYVTFSFKAPAYSTPKINLPQVTAYIIVKTLQKFELDARIKWVNDVLVNDKKLAGILCETEMEGNDINYYVGIGLNVNMNKEQCKSLSQPVTSMALELNSQSINKKEVYKILQENFCYYIEKFFDKGFEYFYMKIENITAFKNELVNFDKEGNNNPKNIMQGIVLGINKSGFLRLRNKDNKEEVFLTGRILREKELTDISQTKKENSLSQDVVVSPFLLSFLKSNKKLILVYKDSGTSANCVRETLDSLRCVIDNNYYEVIAVDKNFVNEALWEEKTEMFVMPGGRSRPYYIDLAGSGKGNDKIINFVNNGGKYLGICAGGYYGCRRTEFEIGNPLEIRCGGILNFFKGVAFGPVYELGNFRYENNDGARIAKINFFNESSEAPSQYEVYYNGGAYFVTEELGETGSDVRILATYADIQNSPPSIIQCNIGKGMAMLTGVHPEYSYHSVETQVYLNENIYNILKQSDEKRLNLFSLLLLKLEIKLIDNFYITKSDEKDLELEKFGIFSGKLRALR